MQSVTTNLPEYHFQVKSPTLSETSHRYSQGVEGRRWRKQPDPGAAVVTGTGSGSGTGAGSSLVNSFISHRNVEKLEVFKRSCRIIRPFKAKPVTRGIRGQISSFSISSKRRLKFTAGNAFPALVTQFGMTYHKSRPSGREVKRHLDRFLKRLRRVYPCVGYLWILEFQRREVPHVHLFLTLPYDTPNLRWFLADSWNDIAEPSSPEHFLVHNHAENLVAWKMGSGAYLCKYLDKEHQKRVPEGFHEVGRFWGCTRGLVPDPEVFSPDDLDRRYSRDRVDDRTGEVDELRGFAFILRVICKAEEKRLRRIRSPWRTKARRGRQSYTLPVGGENYRRVVDYLDKEPPF